MSESRTTNFRRNEALELLLSELNSDLQPTEETLLSACRHKDMPYPLVLVMGPLRSGTTLFMQWLANTHIVAYPTNLLSRFYQAPIIGSKIQLLLTDSRYNFRDELYEISHQIDFTSENGKTKGVLAPNEFWYFWRHFLAEPERDVWTDSELHQSFDTNTMLAELTGIMNVFQKPFATKGMLFNYNIPFLDSILDKVLFVQIKREPIANIASVLAARKRQLGSEEKWYSFKIPEYERLHGLDPISQVAGQIHFINKAVNAGMANVATERKLIVDYETFCSSPEAIHSALCEKLNIKGRTYSGPRSFSSSNLIDESKRDAFRNALDRLSDK